MWYSGRVISEAYNVLPQNSSSPIEMKVVDLSDFDPFSVIFGHFWVRSDHLGFEISERAEPGRRTSIWVSFVGTKVHIGTGMGSGPGGCWLGCLGL